MINKVQIPPAHRKRSAPRSFDFYTTPLRFAFTTTLVTRREMVKRLLNVNQSLVMPKGQHITRLACFVTDPSITPWIFSAFFYFNWRAIKIERPTAINNSDFRNDPGNTTTTGTKVGLDRRWPTSRSAFSVQEKTFLKEPRPLPHRAGKSGAPTGCVARLRARARFIPSWPCRFLFVYLYFIFLLLLIGG